MGMIDFNVARILTFDCYGTLIDWETGLINALRPVLQARGVKLDHERLLEAYARHETELEAGRYVSYAEILAGVLRGLGNDFGFQPSEAELVGFSRSVGDWPPFTDTAPALARLKERFGLGVITNCDDDLFARSNRRLGIEFDWIITAQQARSYKPSTRNFTLAFDRIGRPREEIVHVAQSLYHDHVPAKKLGMRTVWIDRRHGREGLGATPAAQAAPDLTVPDMRAFAEIALR